MIVLKKDTLLSMILMHIEINLMNYKNMNMNIVLKILVNGNKLILAELIVFFLFIFRSFF